MKKRIQTIILFFLSAVFLITCNKKKEAPCVNNNENATLHIAVIDNNGKKVDSARITIFDSYQNYQKGIASKNNHIYANDSIYSKSAAEVILTADPYKEHWLLVTFYDTAQSEYLSSELTMSKLQKLQSCSDYYFKIQLEPTGGNVAFWTSSGINLPIVVQFNNVLDSLKDSTAVQPTDPTTPGTPKELVFPVKAGTYQYQANSQDGCSWSGQVTVKNGQFVAVKLEPCQRAVLAFYFTSLSAIPTLKQTIDVYVDNNPVIAGTLTAPYPSSVLPNSCPGATNVLYLYLDPGIAHTYKAVSAPGSNATPCVWSGGSSVLSTDCTLNPPIFLKQGCL